MNDSAKTYRALMPILVGGLAAGALDLTSAFYFYGRGVPRVIAAGLLGRGVMAEVEREFTCLASCCISLSPSPLQQYFISRAAGWNS